MDADRTVVVVAGGGRLDIEPNRLTAPFAVIAADGGAAEAHRLGLRVDLLVGDLDSATSADVDAVGSSGGTIRRHPTDKDASDLELALDEAMALGPRRIVVLAPAEGRFDFVLANALVLASPRFGAVEIDARFRSADVHVIGRERTLVGTPGDIVSLLAIGGPARGVRTEGLRWKLDGEDLLPGSSRGVSNEFVANEATIGLDGGVLFAVRPGPAIS